ncbi:MAG: diguanylate cyclase [Thermodesulfobacteriota bacterium]
MKILVASDAAEVRKTLGRALQAGDHDCIFADKGGNVIEQVYKEFPDVIILDTQFTDRGGLDLLALLKDAPSTRDIPVLLSPPRRRLGQMSKGYGMGAFDYLHRPYLDEEILAKMDIIATTAERVRDMENKLRQDALTGVLNRRTFMERFNEEIDWASRYREPLSFMILDIDHFKKVNDTYGHMSGDEVLRQVAQTTADNAGNDAVVGRFGGEEFVVLASNRPLPEAVELAERIRSAVQSRRFVCAGPDTLANLSITISVGVTAYSPDTGSTIDSMIAQADDALYAAKDSGRNRVVARGPFIPSGAGE